MKYAPTREYWNDYVFEAYVSNQADVIYLAGLPDIPESRPHSAVSEGANYLRDRQAKTELARINRELKRLKGQIAVLEERRSKLIAGSGK